MGNDRASMFLHQLTADMIGKSERKCGARFTEQEHFNVCYIPRLTFVSKNSTRLTLFNIPSHHPLLKSFLHLVHSLFVWFNKNKQLFFTIKEFDCYIQLHHPITAAASASICHHHHHHHRQHLYAYAHTHAKRFLMLLRVQKRHKWFKPCESAIRAFQQPVANDDE